MSEISKARERIMLNKRLQESEVQLRQPTSTQKTPRKFTVSSFTHQFESKMSEVEFTPVNYTRQNTNRQIVPEPSTERRASRHFESHAKQNTPLMLKTINIKISDISKLDIPSSHRHQQSIQNEGQDSHYFQSPPKVIHQKPLHRERIDLLLVVPQVRRHHSPYKPAECILERTESFIAEQRTNGRSYVDTFFPPERTIIFNKKILNQEEGLKFERLSRIYHNDITIASTCQPTYLSMGKYTNPYVYSALTILTEEPARVLQLFGGQQANESGIYSVNICKDGVWRYVIIDDFVPVKAMIGRKHLLFLKSKQVNETVQIWPALVEKAIAKTYGTYLDLASGQSQGMAEIFRILTGAPAHIYNLNKDFRSYLILIDAALKRKHVVTLQMIPEQNQQSAQLKKLSLNHAYRVVEIKKSGLRIRNYAEPDLLTKLAFEECLIFSRLVIYRLETNYRYITHKLRHKKHYFSKVKVTVHSKTRGYFQIWQNNPAYYKKYIGSQIDYQLARVKIWLGADEGQWIQNGKEIELIAGDYQMHIHLCQQKVYDFTLSYYGEKQITLQRVKNMEEWYEPCLCIPNTN